MNNDQWANVFGDNTPGGESATGGLDSTAEPMSVSHNAQSDGQHMHVAMHDQPEHAYVDAPEPAEHMHVADEPAAERTKLEPEHAYVDGPTLRRTTIYLEPMSLAYLGAVDDMPAAWHVRRAINLYVDQMINPTTADAPAVDPLSVSLTPNAHALAIHVAGKINADMGTLVSAAVLEQLEVMR